MKSYKGFNEDMTCKDFQYEEGKTYETQEAKLCVTGFHACESPLDCFAYYPPGTSIYHEVELNDVSDEKSADSKRVGKKIEIKTKMEIKDLIKAHFEFVKSNIKETIKSSRFNVATARDNGAATAGDRGAATAGCRGSATVGDNGAATVGDNGVATAGDRGVATAGDRGAATAGYGGVATTGYGGVATAGYGGAATAGYCGAATAGYGGAATAGDRGAATAGRYGVSTSRGTAATGANGLSVARGNNVKAKGGLNTIIIIAEEDIYTCNIVRWNAAIVDGEKIKADTWYKLDDNGEFIECEEQS